MKSFTRSQNHCFPSSSLKALLGLLLRKNQLKLKSKLTLTQKDLSESIAQKQQIFSISSSATMSKISKRNQKILSQQRESSKATNFSRMSYGYQYSKGTSKLQNFQQRKKTKIQEIIRPKKRLSRSQKQAKSKHYSSKVSMNNLL